MEAKKRRIQRQTTAPIAPLKLLSNFNGLEGKILAGRVPKTIMIELIRMKNRIGSISSIRNKKHNGRTMFNGIGSTRTVTGNCGAIYTMFQHWTESTTNDEWKNHPLLHMGYKGDETSSRAIESFGKYLIELLSRRANSYVKPQYTYCYRPGIIITLESFHQTPHRDFHITNCRKDENLSIWILHLPLCREGLELNVWENMNKTDKKGSPIKVFVPFGTYLLLRGDVTHGGCFGERGNTRFHMAMLPIETTSEGSRLDFDSTVPTKGLAHNVEEGKERVIDALIADLQYIDDLVAYGSCETTGFQLIYTEMLGNIPNI